MVHGATPGVHCGEGTDDERRRARSAPMADRATVHGEDREELGKNGELTVRAHEVSARA